MGVAADMKEIKRISQNSSIPIVEDAAQSFGGSYMGMKLGTIGDIGCLSFQANKILSTGEGGAIITNNEHLHKKSQIYHDQGGVRKGNDFPSWNHPMSNFGENFRMNEITAAIGLAQLRKIPDMLQRMLLLKNYLRELLSNQNVKFRTSWDEDGDCGIAECFFIGDFNKRNNILEYLRKSGINAHGYYNSAVYENYLFQNKPTKFQQLDICPNAERLAREAIWISFNPFSNEKDIEYIAKTLKKVIN